MESYLRIFIDITVWKVLIRNWFKTLRLLSIKDFFYSGHLRRGSIGVEPYYLYINRIMLLSQKFCDIAYVKSTEAFAAYA